MTPHDLYQRRAAPIHRLLRRISEIDLREHQRFAAAQDEIRKAHDAATAALVAALEGDATAEVAALEDAVSALDGVSATGAWS